MESLQAGLSATPALLTVELDFQVVASGARPPASLSPEQAEQLADAIAADLRRILGDDLEQYGLITIGALYDLPELLRPGLPMIETLLELFRGSLPGGRFMPQVVALGSRGDSFPVATLEPQRRPGSGPLLALPFLFVAGSDAIDRLEAQLESELLEKGTADLATERCIREHFKLRPVNLSYATINDVCAMLKVQFEHGGLQGLWQLLEDALYRPGQSSKVSLPDGNLFLLEGDTVYSPFQTFDSWARDHANVTDTITGYSNWLKTQRQYMAGLQAHGLKTRWISADPELEALCENKGVAQAVQRSLPDQDLLREPDREPGSLSGASIVLVTEHGSAELGAVGYTILVQASSGEVLHLANEYPLQPVAIQRIQDYWTSKARELGVDIHLARPGHLVVADDGRHLMPDLDTGDSATH